LSLLLNHEDLDIGNELKEFKDFTIPLPSDMRGECLSNSEKIRSAHNSFARASPFVDETQRVATNDDDVYHFIAYTPIKGKLYELDGLNNAPISHGPCSGSEFPERVIPVLQRRISRYPTDEIRFNLLALIKDPRVRAREIGDMETLQIEDIKRQNWLWENALRKHNFVGFVGELMKAVVGAKKSQGTDSYARWISYAQKITRDRLESERNMVSSPNK